MSGVEAVAWSVPTALPPEFPWRKRESERVTKLTKDAQPEHGFTVALYSQATVDTLRAQLEAAEAECARIKRDVAELYEAMPSLPIAAETLDAATDWFTRYCVDFSRDINAAQEAARTKEQQA